MKHGPQRWKKMSDYKHDEIKFGVYVGDSGKPILNVFLKDGYWFPVHPAPSVKAMGTVHPEAYKRIWGEPMPSISSINPNELRRPET